MNETELNTIIEQLGLTYNAQFVPTKQPAATVPHPQLHWVCTLAKGAQSMSVPYHQGCAHVIRYQRYHKTTYDKGLHDEMIRQACETGIVHTNWAQDRTYLHKTIKQPKPKLADILYALVMESDVLNCSGFEDWATNYGYNTDSREAERTYRQYLEQSLQLRNLIGQSKFDELITAFQDY